QPRPTESAVIRVKSTAGMIISSTNCETRSRLPERISGSALMRASTSALSLSTFLSGASAASATGDDTAPSARPASSANRPSSRRRVVLGRAGAIMVIPRRSFFIKPAVVVVVFQRRRVAIVHKAAPSLQIAVTHEQVPIERDVVHHPARAQQPGAVVEDPGHVH